MKILKYIIIFVFATGIVRALSTFTLTLNATDASKTFYYDKNLVKLGPKIEGIGNFYSLDNKTVLKNLVKTDYGIVDLSNGVPGIYETNLFLNYSDTACQDLLGYSPLPDVPTGEASLDLQFIIQKVDGSYIKVLQTNLRMASNVQSVLIYPDTCWAGDPGPIPLADMQITPVTIPSGFFPIQYPIILK